ncbi:hypothetical protein AUP07_0691 [methanogenic archaeon mixed culture ISO4-G1]|nr:hypothetical protein AUP07_0691 [methanogenic archaeon mixed culture ISO4-G1]
MITGEQYRKMAEYNIRNSHLEEAEKNCADATKKGCNCSDLIQIIKKMKLKPKKQFNYADSKNKKKSPKENRKTNLQPAMTVEQLIRQLNPNKFKDCEILVHYLSDERYEQIVLKYSVPKIKWNCKNSTSLVVEIIKRGYPCLTMKDLNPNSVLGNNVLKNDAITDYVDATLINKID